MSIQYKKRHFRQRSNLLNYFCKTACEKGDSIFMTGYCSNSPMRCTNAYSLIILNQADNSCSECGLSLVPAVSLSSSSRMELQFLHISLAITILLLLALIYISYANFV